MSRTARMLMTALALAIALGALPAVATAAPAPLEQLSVLVEPMGEGSLVRIIARLPEGVDSGTVEVLVPSVFEASGAEIIKVDPADATAAPEVVGEAVPEKREYDDKYDAYSVEVEGANAVSLTFVAPKGIYAVLSNGHATAKLTLPLASDTKVTTFAFVLPAGAIPVGNSVAEVGKTEEGNVIAGQAFENLKAGEEAKALFAIGASEEAADAMVSAEESQTAIQKLFAGDNLIVMVLIAAVVVIGAVALALALGRRRAAESLEYEEYDEDEDEYETEDDAEAVVEDEAEVTEAEKPAAGEFFRD